MTKIINLNHSRKARNKAEKKSLATRNRLRFGRRKVERRRNEVVEARRKSDLDGRVLRSSSFDNNKLN